MKDRKEVLVIIPAYNEERNIGNVLKKLKNSEMYALADILVINDASSDHTGEVVRDYGCAMITNVQWLGYGSSLQLGYRYAVRRQYRYVIQMDADDQHDVCNLSAIYQRLGEKGTDGEEPDIVLASRFMEGSSAFRVPVLKKVAYVWFRFLIRLLTGRKIADPTTGLQGLSRKAFSYYSKRGCFDERYPDANMVLQMLLLGFRVVELPAVMHARTEGQSMHGGMKAVWYMCRMFFDIPAIVFRVKILRTDAGAGLQHENEMREDRKI